MTFSFTSPNSGALCKQSCAETAAAAALHIEQWKKQKLTFVFLLKRSEFGPQGPPGPPGIAGVPGVDGIDVSKISLSFFK